MPSLHPVDLTAEQRAKALTRLRTRPGARRAAHYADSDEAFELFLLVADIVFRRELGLNFADLADQPWRDWFDDERDPIQCATDLLSDPVSLLFSRGAPGRRLAVAEARTVTPTVTSQP